jgi:hypothetical protein
MKDRVKRLATVTHQHSAVSGSAVKHAQHVVHRVLLECDVVALSLDEQNNISLSNFTPVSYSCQMSGDNN